MAYFRMLYEDERLISRDITVYMYLWDRKDTDGKTWPSVRLIGEELHLSLSSVRRAVKVLVNTGYLKVEQRKRENGGDSSNYYWII